MQIKKLKEEIANIHLDFGIGGCKIGEHYADQILSKVRPLIEQARKEERDKQRQIIVDALAMIGTFSDSEEWDDISGRGQKWLSKVCDKLRQALQDKGQEEKK